MARQAHHKMTVPEPILDYAETDDGWRIALYRYPAWGTKHPPVLLIHGMGSNHYNVDYPDPKYSLAKYLHRMGFDTWTIDLRGAGNSYRPGVFQHWRDQYHSDWTFDDHVFKDLPAALHLIEEVTGQRRLHWIGHSLGGTIAYAALEALGDHLAASVTTLGAAMSAQAKPGFVKLIHKVDGLLQYVPVLPMKPLGRLGSPFSRLLAPLEDNFYYSLPNVDPRVMKDGMKIAVENISMPLFIQMHEWYKDNHFRSLDGKFSYRDNLKKIKAPLLVAAGSVDGLTPYPDVHYAFLRVASKDKQFVVFGREHGCANDYGHMDLLLGKNAQREVYPVIRRWMETHH